MAIDWRPAQLERVKTGNGFIAALDQSGGSTPEALRAYGITRDSYGSETQMFDLMHAMRARIMKDSAFTAEHVIGAILFEGTLVRPMDGMPAPSYLWTKRRIVPFLKVDRGLQPEADGVQLMKPIDDLADLCAQALTAGVLGTKMRSFIRQPDNAGITQVVDQQFTYGRQIIDAGLIPILEPEVAIGCENKQSADSILRDQLFDYLSSLGSDEVVMLKLSLPEVDDFYIDLVDHPNVLRVLALSGGYTQQLATRLLAANSGVIASFSRAFTEGLDISQSDEAFNRTLTESVKRIAYSSWT